MLEALEQDVEAEQQRDGGRSSSSDYEDEIARSLERFLSPSLAASVSRGRRSERQPRYRGVPPMRAECVMIDERLLPAAFPAPYSYCYSYDGAGNGYRVGARLRGNRESPRHPHLNDYFDPLPAGERSAESRGSVDGGEVYDFFARENWAPQCRRGSVELGGGESEWGSEWRREADEFHGCGGDGRVR